MKVRLILTAVAIFIAMMFAVIACSGDSEEDSTPAAGTYSFSGKVLLDSSMTVDGDTNDPNNAIIGNNGTSLTDSQPIANPAIVGGYLGKIGTLTDIVDFYKVSLLKGQTATLVISDSTLHDFDLYLYDESGVVVADSQGTGNYEQVTVPEDGTYYVAAYGYSVDNDGDVGGNYNLIIGQASVGSGYAKSHLSSTLPMVENEVLLRYVDSEVDATASRAQLSALLNTSGIVVQSIQYSVSGVIRMKLEPSKTLSASAQKVFARTVPETIRAVKALRKSANIAYAEPNYIYTAQSVPNDPFYSDQWHYPLISLPEAWDVTTGSSDVIVAVIDTGVVLAHSDLSGQLVAGYDFISNPAISNDGDGIDPDPNDPGDAATFEESSFHGSHVAGTVAAASDNGVGVAGVAWQSKIMPIRVLGLEGKGTVYDISEGTYYAAGLANDSNTVPAKKADVINMSLSGLGYSQILYAAISAARIAEVIIIVSAGNHNMDASNYWPAGFENVITVSAVDLVANKAPYSNWGNPIDVAAPGGNLNADLNNDSYPDGVLSTTGVDGDGVSWNRFYHGTSMASPHVAGVIALMKAVNPNMTQDDFEKLLAGTHPETTRRITDDKGTAGWDIYYGHGLINAHSAVLAASEISGGTPPVTGPVLSVTPESLSFNAVTTTATLTLSNIGIDTLSVSSITDNRTWLNVTPTQGGAGNYTVSVDIAQLATGVYNGLITIVSNGGTATVPVVLSLSSSSADADVGTVYVLLIDIDAKVVVREATTSKASDYNYILYDIPAGNNYLLAATTDMNGDHVIGDYGEAFGLYPTISAPAVITVDKDLADGDFPLDYQLPAESSSTSADEVLVPFKWPEDMQ